MKIEFIAHDHSVEDSPEKNCKTETQEKRAVDKAPNIKNILLVSKSSRFEAEYLSQAFAKLEKIFFSDLWIKK